MFDATGSWVKIKYDINDRVKSAGDWNFVYPTTNNYYATNSNNLRLDVWDNGNAGYDSTKHTSEGNYVLLGYFRFTSQYDVFESRQVPDLTVISSYDSVAYISSDSLFHFTYRIYSGKKYEFSEGCKSEVDICKCKTLDETASSPVVFNKNPIYEYHDGELTSYKGYKVAYLSSGNQSSSKGLSSSSGVNVSSSSNSSLDVGLNPKLHNKEIIGINHNVNSYDLNGRVIR